MIRGLGRAITRHYKIIIVFWIVLLAIAVPFAGNAMNAVQYNMIEMAPANMKSLNAQKQISNQFSLLAPNVAIVFQGKTPNSVLSNETKNVTFAIETQLQSLLNNGKMVVGNQTINGSVLSVYDLMELYGYGIFKVLDYCPELTNYTAFAFYGYPQYYGKLWENASIAGALLYSLPLDYYINWRIGESIKSINNTEKRDEFAYGITQMEVENLSQWVNLTNETSDLVYKWFQLFSDTWNASRNNSYKESNPWYRLECSINDAYLPFLRILRSYLIDEGYSEEMQNLTLLVFNETKKTLYIDSFLAASQINQVAYNVINTLVVDEKEKVYQNITGDLKTMMSVYMQPLDEYMYNFSSKYGMNTTLLLNFSNVQIWQLPNLSRIRLILDELVPILESDIPSHESEIIDIVYNGTNFSTYNNSNILDNLSIAVAHEITGANQSFIHYFFSFGQMNETEIKDFTRAFVRNMSILEYPFPISQLILGEMVNTPENDTMMMAMIYNTSKGPIDGQSLIPMIRGVINNNTKSLTSVSVLVTGSDALDYDMMVSTQEDIEHIDPISIVLVIILIGLFFRSMVTPFLPLAAIGMAVVLALTSVFLIATFVMDVTNYVLVLLTVSMLGAGCDYCIFMLSRYREERIKGLPKKEAVEESVTWAGESITTSAFTVMVGFGVMGLCSFSMVASIGICLAVGIFLALMFALTFLPSVMMVIGDKVFWPAKMEKLRLQKKDPNKQGRISRFAKSYFKHSAKFAIKHAWALIIAGILISIPAIYIMINLETSYDFISTMPKCESREGIDVIIDNFGGGSIMPIYLEVDFIDILWQDAVVKNETEMKLVEQISTNISSLNNIKKVTSITQPYGALIDYNHLTNYSLMQRVEYVEMMERMISKNGRNALLTITVAGEPFSQPSINDVNKINDYIGSVQKNNSEMVLYTGMGGSIPIVYEISSLVQNEFDFIRIIVVLLIYVILLIVLKTVVTPARSIITILMSVFWTLALTVIVFINILNEQVLWLIPIVLFVVCLGLGMDYDIFLTTRIREEILKGKKTNDAIVDAIHSTGGIITICGVIMASAFGTMMLSQSVMLKEFGFALAVAILIDATFIRMYMVPAIMSKLGKWNFWMPYSSKNKKE